MVSGHEVAPPAPAPPLAARGPHVPLLLAAGFLSAVPVPATGGASDRQLAAALRYFPLIGALLGGITAGADWLFTMVLPRSVASVLDLVLLALLTGGIHLDALMDSCDGLFGGRTPDQRLEIMRDSRVGSFAVIGGGLVLLLQYSSLASLPAGGRPVAFIAVAALSRWAMVLAILAFPPARPAGLGATFRAQARPDAALVATLFALLAVAPLRLAAPEVLLATLVTVALAGSFIRAQLRGLSGDSYGAIGELATTAGFVVLAALTR